MNRPSPASGLVFVPDIGFRPTGTRAQTSFTQATAHETRLRVLAVAAAPDRTDVVVEWERPHERGTCPPIVAALASREPMSGIFTATITSGATRLTATSMTRGAYSIGDVVRATHTLSFPALPEPGDGAELRIATAGQDWNVPLDVSAGPIEAAPLSVEERRDGVVVRLTALARQAVELIVGVEAQAAHPIRQVGAALPNAPTFSSEEDPEVLRQRRSEMRRVMGQHARPIVLEYDDGARSEETRRILSPDWYKAATEPPFVFRFAVAFDAPNAEARRATMVIPFVDVNDFGPTATVDLCDVPLDVDLGGHQFRIATVEPYGEERRLALDIPPSTSSPRFVQPARLRSAVSTAFSWSGPSDQGFSMSTTVGDPPVVTFQGVVLRVDGQWRLEIPLIR